MKNNTSYSTINSSNINDYFLTADASGKGTTLQAVVTRAIDMAFALVGCLALLFFIPIVAVLNVFFSPGPLFYSQIRVGKNGKNFRIWKFRSMVVNAEKKGEAKWATQNDNRITKVGKFLRKTRIDEIPQIINLLNGDMTLIGPRPERPQFVEELSKKNPRFALRHAVKPGITGLAQVKYKYGSTEQDAFNKLRYDLIYIKNKNLILDIDIMMRTVGVVASMKGL